MPENGVKHKHHTTPAIVPCCARARLDEQRVDLLIAERHMLITIDNRETESSSIPDILNNIDMIARDTVVRVQDVK